MSKIVLIDDYKAILLMITLSLFNVMPAKAGIQNPSFI